MADDATQRNPNPPTPAGHVKAQPPAVSPEVHGAVAPSALAAVAPKPAASTSPIGRVKQFLWPQNTGYAAQVESSREVVETIVFVVILVLLLKSFAAEAFVIPTGSMATTLWGYQRNVTCPKCAYFFPVNYSSVVDPQDGQPRPVEWCTCPNCREQISLLSPQPLSPRDELRMQVEASRTGDRVLVAKFIYDLLGKQPKRLDVVVFKYPKEPQKNYTPMNYIKRLIGLPEETI